MEPVSSLLLQSLGTDKIIDMSSVKNLVDVCLHETGGIGVNVVVDSGGESGLCSTGELQCLLSLHTVSPGYALSDFIIDSPALVQQLKSESERYGGEFTQSSVILPSKHQIINMLAPQGQWVTAQPDLQVLLSSLISLISLLPTA